MLDRRDVLKLGALGLATTVAGPDFSRRLDYWKVCLKDLPAGELPAFRSLVFLAFAQRRKMLRNSLESGWGRERAAAVLEEAAIDGRRRAETLAIDELLELHRAAKKIP